MRMDIRMEKMSQKALERKSNKPIMEKKRRARINHCLNQLKSLILEADNERSRHSKLEKADILEMTVKYLQTLRAYHVHLNQINQLQHQQHQQSQQHQQLQQHFQQQLNSNLKLQHPMVLGAQSPLSTAPNSPIDLQMPVSLAQLPLPLQLSLQAAAASHQLADLSPKSSPSSTTSSASSSPSSSSGSPNHIAHSANQQNQQNTNNVLQHAHQNHQQLQLNRHLSQLEQANLGQNLSHRHHHHHISRHLNQHQQQAFIGQQISPTWRPW